jgi:histone chaperone ASF1
MVCDSPSTNLANHIRDSEATAPPEFPPEQPEADIAPDDETAYGAEEPEEEEEEEVEAAEVKPEGDDAEMGGVEKMEEDEGNESEDIEGDSSEEEEEEEELEEEGEGEDMEMDDAAKHAAGHENAHADVMVH